jgi:hypothetical protein
MPNSPPPGAPGLDSETGEVNDIPNSPGAPVLDFETGEANNTPNSPGAGCPRSRF